MATQQVTLRLPATLFARLKSHAARMRRASPGVEVTRTDAARALLTFALDEIERAEREASS